MSRTMLGYAVLALAYLVMLFGAATASPWLFALGAVGGYAMDAALIYVMPDEAHTRLNQLRMGPTTRALLRQLLLLGLLATAGVAPSILGWVILSLVALFVVQFFCSATARLLAWRRKLPVVTRNIDLTALRIPNSPPMWLFRSPVSRLLPLDAFLIGGVLTFLFTGFDAAVAVGILAALGLSLAYQAALAWHLWRSRTIPRAPQVMAFVQRWLHEYRPEVVLYFSGNAESVYQVNMWLECMEKLSLRPLIVLRERIIAAHLSPTPVPVLCVPTSTDVMALDFEPARVALYPANTGKNLHMLRNPQMSHVFIGHGDSDKVASINPFTKVHDEVWTAGKAGRDRYALAGVGVRDATIVEVGRPQLDEIRSDTAPRSRRTVLYAPTWEGWTDEPGNTSIIKAGPAIIERLLRAEPAVRVIYKPHPFTGIRSGAARRAHQRIVALIGNANGGPERPRRSPADLAVLERALAAFDEDGGTTDEAHHSREEGRADPGAAARLRELNDRWHTVYWDSVEDDRHLVVQGPRPSLYSCFYQADLLVSDISSVVADFIATEKPYAIANCAGAGHSEFCRKNPTASAAYMLGPDGEGLDEALRAVHEQQPDELAGKRAELRDYLLGPREPRSQVRFDRAVRDLYRRTSRHRPVTGKPPGSDPQQLVSTDV